VEKQEEECAELQTAEKLELFEVVFFEMLKMNPPYEHGMK